MLHFSYYSPNAILYLQKESGYAKVYKDTIQSQISEKYRSHWLQLQLPIQKVLNLRSWEHLDNCRPKNSISFSLSNSLMSFLYNYPFELWPIIKHFHCYFCSPSNQDQLFIGFERETLFVTICWNERGTFSYCCNCLY